ncbi:glycosyltransferase family 9 protein [Zavarzinella formosa]|uniref:glycosyltransferase family 9 protein n=1 Tax=Zavarzinella formosa TaxID=360055 RepID=UPI00030147F7|nr:glycosyltransferase family 9 protein [Zavarzinella formosa]
MRNIALFLPNWIGDVVMATPAIRAVRDRWPQANLFAVCKPYVAATLEGSPWFAGTILYDRKGPKDRREVAVIRQLRTRGMDAAVLFPNSFRAAMIAALGRCRRRVGFNRYGRGFLLTDKLAYAKDERGKPKPCPVIDDYNRLVVKLGTDDPGYRMELFTTPTDEAAADRVWNDLKLHQYPEVIGLNSSGAFGASKLWPTEYFAKLAGDLARRRGGAVLVVCGPNERETAKAIVAGAGHPNVFSLADRPVSIGLTKACVKRLDLLVTTDSGPRHFAAAFDRPVVSLFGPTFIEWTETYFAKAINLQKKVPCGPCQLRVCPTDHRCMTELTVDDVRTASEELLERVTPRRVRLVG